MNVTLDLGEDKDLLDLLVPAVEDQLYQAEQRMSCAEEEVKTLRAKLERVRAKVAALTFSVENPQRAPSGRMKKGESERMIQHFLQNRNGTGATLKEVMVATGTTYGTARRILLSFVSGGQVTEARNRFSWATDQNGSKSLI